MRYNIKLVTEWAIDKGLVGTSNQAVCAQFIKGVEEGGEIFDAILNRDKDELIDAIGDRLVVATIECLNAGLDPQEYIKRVNHPNFYNHGSFGEAVATTDALKVACEYGATQGRLARAVAKQQPIEQRVIEVVLVLNRLATLLCVDIGECYRIAYNVIRNRTGSTVDGVFVKDE
jgi:phosphoribosyl-ATP pyrophosphohydrolase